MDWHNTAPQANGDENINLSFPSLQPFSPEKTTLPTTRLLPSGAMPTAGSQLGQMMELNAARPPQATQGELRALLQHFSHQRTHLRDTFFYANAEFMESISRTITGQIVGPTRKGEIYVGVQRLSRVASQMPRYRAMAQNAGHVYLYGIDDLRDPSERVGFSHPRFVTFILDQSRRTDLEWFWFMVMNIPGLQTALIAEQVEDNLWSDSQQSRVYKCLWSFNSARVQQIVDILQQAARILRW